MFVKAGSCWLCLKRVLLIRTYVEDGEPRADVALDHGGDLPFSVLLTGQAVDDLLTELERLRRLDWHSLAERGLYAVERMAERVDPRSPRQGGPLAEYRSVVSDPD